MTTPFEAWAGGSAPAIVPALQTSVDALLTLYAAAKLAHWNVRGPLRVPLHQLFGEVAEVAANHADGLAVARALSEQLVASVDALLAAQDASAQEPATLDALTVAVRALEKLGADLIAHAG